MSFKYLNPGYGSWLNDPDVVTIENNFTYNPEHGVSFQKLADSTYNETRIAIPQAFTTDIYGKFNLYYDYENSMLNNFSLGAISTYSSSSFYDKCLGITIYNNVVHLLNGSGRYITNSSSNGIFLSGKTLNQIQFHVHVGDSASTSYGKLIVNDKELDGTTTSSIANFSSANYFSINFLTDSNYGDKLYISELMISDEPISPKEKIVILSSSPSADTDMAAGSSGIYTATAANQSVLLTPDVASLITEYGANSKVTGIAVVGDPAYRTGTGLASLTGISKSGSSIAEHGSYNLSTNSTSVIQDSWTLDNSTISDIQSMQFGWRAGT